MVHTLPKARAPRIAVLVISLGILLGVGTLTLFSQDAGLAGRNPEAFKYLIGVDYFPAFHYNAWRWGDEWLPLKLARPWVAKDEVQPKRPLAYLGYYDDTQPSTWDRQITLANKFGVSFFFIQYGLTKGVPVLDPDKVLDALVASSKSKLIRFAINWMEGDEREFSRTYFTNFLDHVEKYFRSPSYLKIDGKPVVGLLHWHSLSETLRDRIRDMQAWAKGKGYPGLYFVASSVSPAYGEHLGASKAFSAGVDAVSCLAWPLAGTSYEGGPRPEGQTAPYVTAAEALRHSWEDAYVPSGAAVFPFPNSGWDDTPWGGKRAFVRTGSSAEGFSKQLVAAKEFIDKKKITPRVVIIASWNEWGEGHFVEPCEPFGYSYLDAIGRTFNGIDESTVLALDHLPADSPSAPSEIVFDDFVSDGRTWIGYVGDPKSCMASGSCQLPSYYGATANLRIQNLNPDGTLSGGILSYLTTGKDPMFAKLVLGLNGDVYRTLEMRYRLGAASDAKRYTDLTLYWTNEEDHPPDYGAFGYSNFGGCPGNPHCCSLTYWSTLVADGNWHVLQVKLDDPKWRGIIWSVRIELPHGSAPGIPVDVDYVHFLKGSG
jgi:hypothetical protein